MIKHKEQRVGVFVDVQNLYYSAKALFSAKVNFKEVLKEAVAGRKLIHALAYVVKTDIYEKEKEFFNALSNFGFEVRSKDLQIFVGGAKKGNWDVGLTVDAIELAPKLDVVVLVSGDGDFISLIEHLKHAQSCFVEVMAFRKSTSGALIEAADGFTDLSLKKFLISK
ncbi:MAG: NYN domain-containing protein [Patescibacteria group bacterium]